jgi:hypothetical protein
MIAWMKASPTRMTAVVGFGIFLLFAGISGIQSWTRYSHTANWPSTEAVVSDVRTMCDLQQKSGKDWRTRETLDCEIARQEAASKSSLISHWRAVEVRVYDLAYIAGSREIATAARASLIGAYNLVKGDKVTIHHDPNDPLVIDRPFGRSDLDFAFLMSGVGLAAWAGIWLIGVFVSRFSRTAPAAQPAQAAGAIAAMPAPAPAPSGTSEPLLARIVRLGGTSIAVILVIFAGIAAYSSFSKGEGAVLSGAGIIATFGLFVWRTTSWISSRMSRAAGR